MTFRYHVSNAELDGVVSLPSIRASPADVDWVLAPGGTTIRRVGMDLEGAFDVGWLASDHPCEFASAVIDALVGVVLGCPWIAPRAEVTFRGRPCAAPTLEWAHTTPAELAAALSSPVPMSHRVRVSSSAIEWMGDVLSGLTSASAGELRELLPTLSALDSAAQATHPYDQVLWQWVALEGWGADAVARTADSVLAAAATRRGVIEALYAAASEDVSLLIRARKRLASNDHVRDKKLCAQLLGPLPRGPVARLRLGVGCAIALRHAIVHADIPRFPPTERGAAKGARGLLWLLAGCLMEQKLVGRVSSPRWTAERVAITF